MLPSSVGPRPLPSRDVFFRTGRALARWTVLVVGLVIVAGCSRARYRHKADMEAYGLVDAASLDPRWPLDDYTIEPDPESRFFDPYSRDCPPMPPDDPTAHQLLHYVDGKRNWPYEQCYGFTDQVENPAWIESLRPYLRAEPSEEGDTTVAVIDREASMELALLHSREYQRQLEILYLSALDVSLQRFAFDVQFFGGNTTSFTKSGPISGSGGDTSELRTDSSINASRLCATGGQLATEVANSVVWQFSGADSYVSTTPISFSLIQPLLRGAGRAVVLNQLTTTERRFLANVRDLERFRREFYIDVVAGSGGRAGGLLGLLRDKVQIRNQERNVIALEDSLRQTELSFARDPTGRTQADSVELTRQRWYEGQSRLVRDRANFESALDSYKINLGLPPDLTIRIEDPLLDRFNLIDPQMSALQDATDALKDKLGELTRERDGLGRVTQPMPPQELIQTASLRQECEAKLEMVERDLEQLRNDLPHRRELLGELADRDEFRRGDVDPTLVDVDELNKRAVQWHVDFYGPGDPQIEQAASQLLTTPEQQDWFRTLTQDRQAAGLVGVAVAVRVTLAELEAFERDPAGATASANAAMRQDPTREQMMGKTPTEIQADVVTRLWRQVVRLSVVQARARLDAITLIPIDLSPEEAFQIAGANRRDWMNARAELVDTWRQIEVRANALRSDLDVAFSGDLTTRSSTFGTNNTTGRLQARLEFDAPLTRLAERNAYRRALIEYQQARRDYYAFEDDVQQSLRALLRTIRLSQLDFEIARGSVAVAIMRVDFARRELEKPAPASAAGGGIAGTRELVDSLDALLAQQNSFAGAWVDYEAQRMQLDLDLGTMQLDDRGMWIDPGPVEGAGSWMPEGPERIPAPPPEIPLDFNFPPPEELPAVPNPEGPAPRVALHDVPAVHDIEDRRRRPSLRRDVYVSESP